MKDKPKITRYEIHEHPAESMLQEDQEYKYIPYRTLEEAKADNEGVVIFTGDYGGQVYLTCPVRLVNCSEATLKCLLTEMGKFAWGDGEQLSFERARPDGFVSGGMGGGHIQEDVWIHKDFRGLFDIGMDILPEVTAVIKGHAIGILPGIVSKLVVYLEGVDLSKALPDQKNYAFVGDIVDILEKLGAAAQPALSVLKKLAASGQFDGGPYRPEFRLSAQLEAIQAKIMGKDSSRETDAIK